MITTWVISRPSIRQTSRCVDSLKLSTVGSIKCPASSRFITQRHLRKLDEAASEWDERKEAIKNKTAKSLLQRLEERGLVNQIVGNRDELDKLLTERRVGVYCGVDPTAASMHIGHMIPFMALAWMYVHGYNSTFLMGGFTASIGDPTDRLTARTEVASTERTKNAMLMFEQLKRLAAGIERYADRRGLHREWAWRRSVRNNTEWWSRMSVGEFLGTMGRVTRIGPLLGRDSVKNRLEKGDGMSFAEFSYPLMQAWDWWHMFQSGTQIQIGGADQFGNILAGAEAVKAVMQQSPEFLAQYQKQTKNEPCTGDPMGFTVPLLTTSSGEKFGKSAGNAIWIDPQLTSSFELYQFFLRASDDDVEKYLKMLTFLPISEIREVMKEHRIDPSKRIAQKKLGDEFVELVHGLGAAQTARSQHEQLYSKTLSLEDIRAQAAAEATATQVGSHPRLDKKANPLDMFAHTDVNITLPRSLVYQQTLPRILYHASLVPTRSEGQRLVNAGGVYIAGAMGENGLPQPIVSNNITYVPAKDPKWSSIEPLVIDGNLLVLRTGKWKKKFITIVSDDEYRASGQTCPGWNEDPLDATVDEKGEARYHKQALDNQAARQEWRQRRSRSSGFGTVTGVQSS